MYEELVKRLRRCAQFKCRECEYEQIMGCRAKLDAEAADAIEKLQDRIAASEATIKRQSDIIKAKDRDLQRMINATSKTFEPITNQEAMARLSPEEFYKKMHWLLFSYGFQFNSTELAVIEWLKEEAKE